MNRYMLLHIGFEKPTPEIMEKWQQWFASVADKTVEHGGLMHGRELTHDGVRELPWDRDAMTGFSIINAESIEEAEALASGNPFITSIRIYEIRSHG